MKNNFLNGGLTLLEVLTLEHRHVEGGENTHIIIHDLSSGVRYFDGAVKQWFDSPFELLRKQLSDKGVYAIVEVANNKFVVEIK